MANYKTVKVFYGRGLKNRLADYLHRHGKIRIIYSVPIIRGEDNVGEVATIVGSKMALWVIGKLFEQEGVEMFAIR